MEGFLHKRKNEKASTLFGATNKRWFTLDPVARTFFYAESKSGKQKRQISLETLSAVAESLDQRPKPKGFPFAFALTTAERNYVLYTSSSEELHAWLSAFSQLLARPLGNPASGPIGEEEKKVEARMPFGESPQRLNREEAPNDEPTTPQKEIAQVEIHDKENYFNSPEGRRVSLGSDMRSDSKSPQKRNVLPVSPVPKSLLGR